jgi:hypothetical protein
MEMTPSRSGYSRQPLTASGVAGGAGAAVVAVSAASWPQADNPLRTAQASAVALSAEGI